jgi:hypothetical protein
MMRDRIVAAGIGAARRSSAAHPLEGSASTLRVPPASYATSLPGSVLSEDAPHPCSVPIPHVLGRDSDGGGSRCGEVDEPSPECFGGSSPSA